MRRKKPKFPRSLLAERVARKWLRAAKAPRMPTPVVRYSKGTSRYVSGHYYPRDHRIHLSLSNRRCVDWWILLAHELAHAVLRIECKKGDQSNGTHGPRFFWWFWRILPKRYWKYVTDFQWGKHRHYPEYQPCSNPAPSVEPPQC